MHFTNSGAEANEAALKLARKWGRLHRGGAHQIITTLGSFHGRTLALMAASGKPGWDALFPPVMPGFVKVPYGDVAAVRAQIGPETVAVMVEPIQGEAGVVVPPDGYLAGLRRLCDEHGLLLICDEVQTGMGRTGTLFAFEREQAQPDILTLGKGLGGGVPISAVLANERASCFVPGDQGGTYNGNPLMVAVARTIFDVVSRAEFLATVRARGRYLEQRLAPLCAEHGLALRGRGLLWALVLPRADCGGHRRQLFCARLADQCAAAELAAFDALIASERSGDRRARELARARVALTPGEREGSVAAAAGLQAHELHRVAAVE